MSSTTRIRGVGWVSALISLTKEAPNLVGELAHADRLGEVTVEALGEESLLVAPHRRGRQRNDRDPAGSRVLFEQLERFRAAEIRHADVHQHEGGHALMRQRDPLDAARRLEGLEAGELEHVPGQLPVVLVVVDDQDQLAHDTSCRMGRVKRNVLPLPGSLSTQRRPPCSSTSRRESGRPRPVPSACLPSLACSNSSKIVSRSGVAIPGPVSATSTSTWPSSRRADTSMRPSGGVNLTALERRLNTTWRTRRSSAVTAISAGSVVRLRSTPLRLACSECSETALRRRSGMATSESSRSMRPASILARSRTSLISDSRCLPAS